MTPLLPRLSPRTQAVSRHQENGQPGSPGMNAGGSIGCGAVPTVAFTDGEVSKSNRSLRSLELASLAARLGSAKRFSMNASSEVWEPIVWDAYCGLAQGEAAPHGRRSPR